MKGLTVGDFLLLPIYLLIIWQIFKQIRKKYAQDPLLYKYFTWGFIAKIILFFSFTILTCFVMEGDSVTLYFESGKLFANLIPNNIGLLFTKANETIANLASDEYKGYLMSENNYMVIKICALLCYITFYKYFLINLVISFIVFLSSWHLFLFFRKLYPLLHKNLAIGCMGIPSVLFWSSGIGKDAICLASIFFITKFMFDIFTTKNKIVVKSLVCLLAIYLTYSIKPYILYCYFPFYLIFLMLYGISNTKNKNAKLFYKFFVGVFIFSIFVFLLSFSEDLISDFANDLLLENLANTKKAFDDQASTGSGAFFTLGDFDGTINGLVGLAPTAIFTSMFRPFIWESNNLLYLISSLESSFFTYLVLRLFLKINHFFTIMRLIFTKPIVIYCVFFSLFFFLFVGISSTNFGSLIRYKIPSTPFLLIAIFIIEFEIRQKIKATKNK